MKFPVKNIKFITALLALAAVYAGCTKGPDIKTYTYPVPEPKAIFPDSGYAALGNITITGAQFGDYKAAVKVFFGGVEADTVLSCEDGKIVVRVPRSAISGKVSLQVWNHTIDSFANFRVMANPIVRSVNEQAGVPGDVVVISGTNFGYDQSRVRVNFNGVPATVNSVKDDEVSVTVPADFQPGNITLAVDSSTAVGPTFGILVATPTPILALDFERNLIDKISGDVATYNKGKVADLGWEPGQRGMAVKFHGYTTASWNEEGTVKLPNPSIFKQAEFTVTCWINWATGRDIYPDPIFEFGEARATRIAFLTRMGSGTNNWNSTNRRMVGRFLMTKGSVSGFDNSFGALGADMLKTNVWYHVAFVFSYPGQVMKIYIDGKEAGSKTLTSAAADPFLMTYSKAYIGGAAFGSGTETNFVGLMDNFRIYNQVLTPDQIYTDLYKK